MLARLVGLMTLLLTNFAFANVCDLELSQNISNRPFQTNIKIDPEFNKLYLVVVIKYRVEYKELPAFLDPSYFPLVYNELKPVQKRELQDYLNRALELPLNDVTWGDFSQNKILLLYVTRIKELLLKHKIAVGMSLALHNGSHQKYGNKNYDYHIRKLRAIAKRFGFGPKNSIFGLKLGTVLWLHDAPEDQDLEISLVRRLHGNEIANAVWGMTNVPKTSEHRELAKKCKSKSCTSEEKEHLANLDYQRKIATLEKTKKYKLSRIGKLIDRTGNFEEAIMSIISSNGPNPTYFKYKKEWPLFKQYLYRPGEADELWLHLERLFTDEEYLNEFIWSRVSRRDLGT